jgi:hypothetical protein
MTGEDVPGAEPARDGPDGAVDRYLDELFEGLAGTGPAGRRALAEAEDHLRASVADLVAEGVAVEQAERDAVTRFGPATLIAAQLRRAHRGHSRGAVLSGGWLLAALTLAAFGATYLVKALDIAVLSWIHPEGAAPCPANLDQIARDRLAAAPPGSVVSYGPCSTTVSAMHDNTRLGLLFLLLAAAVFLIRRLAVRRAGLQPAPRRLPLLAAGLFAVAGLVLFVVPATPLGHDLVVRPGGLFGVEPGPGLHHAIIASGVALLMSGAAVLRHRAGRSRGPSTPM